MWVYSNLSIVIQIPHFTFFLLIIKILNLDHLHLITSFFPGFFKLFFECFKLFCKFFFRIFLLDCFKRFFFYLKLSIYLWSPSFLRGFIDFLLLFLGIFLCLLIWFRNTNFSRFIAQFQIFFLIQFIILFFQSVLFHDYF